MTTTPGYTVPASVVIAIAVRELVAAGYEERTARRLALVTASRIIGGGQ